MRSGCVFGGSDLAQLFEGSELRVPNDDVVEDLYLEEVARLVKVPCDPEVGEGRGRIAARMIVLCEALDYVTSPVFWNRALRL